MPALKLHNASNMDMIMVPGTFIDRYMPQASGEFVKVYFSLLRYMDGRQPELSISGLADFLNHTENDVIRALKYWERMGLLRLEYAGEEIREITILALTGTEENRPAAGQPRQKTEQGRAVRETAAARASAPEELPDRDEASLKKLEGDEEFKQFLFVAGQYIGTPLSRRDCDTFAYLYDRLKMPAELLEYLIEYCISMGHRSVRYMEAVALDMHKKEILTVEQAKAALPAMKKDLYAVMKAFGLQSRQPAAGEKQMMEKWFSVQGLSVELVLEACNRTMSAIHKPSFEYADKILEGWKENGVKTLQDVTLLDQRRSQNQPRRPSRDNGKKQAGRPNQFHNFEQRDYDYEELMKQLNQL